MNETRSRYWLRSANLFPLAWSVLAGCSSNPGAGSNARTTDASTPDSEVDASSTDAGADSQRRDASVAETGTDGPEEGSAKTDGGTPPPPPAAAVGYNTLTDNSTLISSSQGNWYPWGFYGGHVPPSNYTQNADGTINLQDNTTATAALASAEPADNPQGFHGVGYGGGLYWEVVATITDPGFVTPAVPAALWILDIEHTSQGAIWNGSFWPSSPQLQNEDGSSGYDDYIEIDMMEFDFGWLTPGYEINMSNWNDHVAGQALNWGPSNDWPRVAPIPSWASGGTPVPAGTDFTQQHKYGMLWVPATGSGQTTKTPGYVSFFFDGVQISGGLTTGPTPERPCYWNYHDPTELTVYPTPTQAGAPTAQGQLPPTVKYFDVDMSILDWRHMLLIMNSGSDNAMTIYSSRVWQQSAANNLMY